jgi:hypothetical protein
MALRAFHRVRTPNGNGSRGGIATLRQYGGITRPGAEGGGPVDERLVPSEIQRTTYGQTLPENQHMQQGGTPLSAG